MKKLVLLAAVLAVGGCNSQHAPLIFGQTHSVGIAVGTNPANQTPEISVGYKDLNIAIVPTVDDVSGELIQGQVDGGRDAYSTFGHFSTSAEASKVGLGKFFATGNAAVALGAGFACEASGYQGSECSGRGTP